MGTKRSADKLEGMASMPTYPLPEEASGFRKKSQVDQNACMESTSVPGMTVGNVRKCLSQIRTAGPAIMPEHLLFNGWTAGRFALTYVIGHYHNRQAKYGPSKKKSKTGKKGKEVAKDEKDEKKDEEGERKEESCQGSHVSDAEECVHDNEDCPARSTVSSKGDAESG